MGRRSVGLMETFRLLLVVFSFSLFVQCEQIGVFLHEARSPVGQSAHGLGDHGLQGVKLADNDVAIADTPAFIVVFVVQVRVHRRPDRAGDLVGDRKSDIDAELLYLLDVVSVVGIMP
jgi:hypothetical protein